jgi:integrase
MPLSDAQVRSLKPAASPKKYSDGGGLHLLVPPHGSKLWRLSYRFGGKQKTIALGAYPVVTLADARQRRDNAKRLLLNGADPSQHAKVEKIRAQIANATTFNAVADELLRKVEREGKAAATLAKKRWLIDLARPSLGSRPIADISAVEVLVALRQVESKGNFETARRMRAAVGQVFRYAIATSAALNDPTFGLKGALTAPVVTHRAAFTDPKGFGGMLRAIWDYPGAATTRLALQLMALLYPRPGELRQAEWTEFDLDKAIWVIPAARTKMRREHRKPLSGPAVALLRELHRLTGQGRLIFPAVHSTRRPLSENTMNSALRRMGFTKDEATSHGFRATASTLLNESRKWHADAIEVELGHVGADEVRRAYHRALYWDERVRMAEWWAGEIDRLRESKA